MKPFKPPLRNALLLLLSMLLISCSGDEPAEKAKDTAAAGTVTATEAPAAAGTSVPDTGEAAAERPPVECEALADIQNQEPATESSAQGLSPALQTTFERTCKMCHTNPAAGAPLVGDHEAWAPRLAQGREQLLDHTIDGYKGMPPLGLCMACSEDDFVDLIEFMSGHSLNGEG